MPMKNIMLLIRDMRTVQMGYTQNTWCCCRIRTSRPRWEDNIKMGFKEIKWKGQELSGPGKGQVEGSGEHGNESQLTRSF
jgi:hypothetical protein